MIYNLLVVKQYLPLFKEAFVNTITVSVVSLFLSLAIGTIGGLCRISKNKLLYGISSIYVNAIRSTPLLAQLYLVFFGFPYLGISFSNFNTGVIILTLNSGAYITEIVRSGIQAIPKEQTEAALSLGMNYFTMMRLIILPQAFIIIIPSLVNQLSMLVKGSGLLCMIAYVEITRAAQTLAMNAFSPNEGYLTSAFLYLIICSTLMGISAYLVKRQHKN